MLRRGVLVVRVVIVAVVAVHRAGVVVVRHAEASHQGAHRLRRYGKRQRENQEDTAELRHDGRL